MTTIPDLGQAHETCGRNRLLLVVYPATSPHPNEWFQKKKSKKTKPATDKPSKSNRKSPDPTREYLKHLNRESVFVDHKFPIFQL